MVLHGEKITGYTSGFTYFNHSVGFSNDDLKALIASETITTVTVNGGPGILIPTRNAELFRWCLDNKLRLVHQLNLMTIGMYNEPAGYYMPSSYIENHIMVRIFITNTDEVETRSPVIEKRESNS